MPVKLQSKVNRQLLLSSIWYIPSTTRPVPERSQLLLRRNDFLTRVPLAGDESLDGANFNAVIGQLQSPTLDPEGLILYTITGKFTLVRSR